MQSDDGATPTLAAGASPLVQQDTGATQAVKTQLQLRELILSGELPGGARIAELAIVERLGVSRTPIRSALMRLEQEGLLEALPNGGYAVRTFSERDVSDAIELRGTLEGLCVRLAAERGAPPVVMGEARACLQEIDALLLDATALDDAAFSEYVRLNGKLHGLLAEMAGSEVLRKELERVARHPFASPSAFALVQANSPRARDMLLVAQHQHQEVLDAIDAREGTRAESLMREHSRIAQRNLRDVVRSQHPGRSMPGVRLIRKRH